MAWGYWSATSVPDRGRSPARRQTTTPTPVSSGPPAPAASNSSGSADDEDYAPPPPVSRRPSLADEYGGPGGLALVLCSNTGRAPGHDSLPRSLPLTGSNILRHECFLHQSAALVHHHQCRVHDLSGSEDDEPEPGYASGTVLVCPKYSLPVVTANKSGQHTMSLRLVILRLFSLHGKLRFQIVSHSVLLPNDASLQSVR